MIIRGQRVMLSDDLARMYGVAARRLNQAVKRNRERFPDDFVFRLSPREQEALISRGAMSKKGHGGRRTLPYVFTEHGAVMLASVLNSSVAVSASIQIVRAFNRMRHMIAAHKDLAAKLAELERKFESHDAQIDTLFETIRGFLEQPAEPPRRIGFKPPEGDG